MKSLVEFLNEDEWHGRFVKLSQMDTVVAKSFQDGYTLRIHVGRELSFGRMGIMTIESPNGTVVQAG